jgi:hypothetical protein
MGVSQMILIPRPFDFWPFGDFSANNNVHHNETAQKACGEIIEFARVQDRAPANKKNPQR